MKQHWYRIHIRECPVCGRGETTRERVYGQRPVDPAERYDYNGMAYDYCLEF
jgi:hypothetical protein